jgi:hypothetical protein
MRTIISLLLCTLILTVGSFAQSTNTSGVNANTLILGLLSRTGWSSVPADANATGTVRNASDAAGQGSPVQIRASGRTKLRFDVTLEGNTATTIVNGSVGSQISNGVAKTLPSQAALTLKVPVFPFMDALQGIGTTKVARYVGTQQLRGIVADVVDIIPVALKDDAAGTKRSPHYFRIWIARDTGLLAQIAFVRLARNNSLAATTYLRTFSDYRSVDGRLFPFHQEQSIQGEMTDIIVDFTSVAFGTGLLDTVFDVPTSSMEVQQ